MKTNSVSIDIEASDTSYIIFDSKVSNSLIPEV